jgi:glycosyltransferase involved in cell wall biosynthesis
MESTVQNSSVRHVSYVANDRDATPFPQHRELPLVSVVVRSYRRAEPLLELVGRLRSQVFPRFELVILEQSEDPELIAQLAALDDPRMRVIASPPLNPPAARNAAIRHARGSILLFVDDDDLPIGNDWITSHVANYWDQRCMGVVGRLVSDPTRLAGPRYPRLIRALAMRYTWFCDTRAYAHNTLRKKGIDFLIGSNASVRRSLVERIGGWDEGIPVSEEQSFSFRFAKLKCDQEHFTFDPRPIIWRRTDVPGGLARRKGRAWYLRELEARLFFYRHVVGYYFPVRYQWARPLFFPRAVFQVLEWIWDSDNRSRSFVERLTASLDLLLRGFTALKSKRYSASQIRRMPSCSLPK